jgi:predicted  nucleic acid-binding Zn-ribbon protein
MYAAEKMSIAEVQDEIRKVEGKLEELGNQTQEDVEKMSKVERHVYGRRKSFF